MPATQGLRRGRNLLVSVFLGPLGGRAGHARSGHLVPGDQRQKTEAWVPGGSPDGSPVCLVVLRSRRGWGVSVDGAAQLCWGRSWGGGGPGFQDVHLLWLRGRRGPAALFRCRSLGQGLPRFGGWGAQAEGREEKRTQVSLGFEQPES